MGGMLEPAGQDGILMHVNPTAPQLTILPAETLLVPGQSQVFEATATVRQGVGLPDLDLSGEVDWTLFDPSGAVLDSGVDSSTFTVIAPSSPGRYVLEAEVTDELSTITATYRQVFYVSELPAPPSGLEADVTLKGRNSSITLRWSDNSDNEAGFYIEYLNQRLTGGSWAVLDEVAANTTTFSHCVGKRIGIIQYRIRSFADFGIGEVLSPVTEVLEVNPSKSGTVTATSAASMAVSSDLASAADSALQDDELFSRGKAYVA
jgi:hypothetical protein